MLLTSQALQCRFTHTAYRSPDGVNAVAGALQVGMLTGDNAGAANAIASTAGLDVRLVHSQLLPEDKLALVCPASKSSCHSLETTMAADWAMLHNCLSFLSAYHVRPLPIATCS